MESDACMRQITCGLSQRGVGGAASKFECLSAGRLLLNAATVMSLGPGDGEWNFATLTCPVKERAEHRLFPEMCITAAVQR
jgi:hypothetical protein